MPILITNDGRSGDIDSEILRLERLLADMKRIRDGKAPDETDLARAPAIDQFVGAMRPAPCLVGEVTGHPTLRGSIAMTSALWVVAWELGWVRTLSRFYVLGRPLGVDGHTQ